MKHCLKKVLIVSILSVFLVANTVGCLPAVGPQQEEIETEEKRELLVPPKEKQEVDLSVLNEVEEIIRKNSVSRGKLADKVTVAENVFDFFFIYLGITPDKIPDWAHEEKDRAIREAIEGKNLAELPLLERIFEWLRQKMLGHLGTRQRPIDYGFFNKILERLIHEEGLSYLDHPEERFRILEATIKGFIASIYDPFAEYVNPTEVRLGATEGRGQYEGLGIGIRMEGGRFIINMVVKGSPAEKAGLQVDDIIVYIDNKDLTGATVREIGLYIRGKVDPKIVLTIERNKEIFNIAVIRETIKQVKLSSWPSFDLPEGRGNTADGLPYTFPIRDQEGNQQIDVAYIKIKNFSTAMVHDLYFVLNNIDWTKYRKLIIDVRENPGGYVYTTIAALSYFLPPSTVAVIVQDHTGWQEAHLTPRAPITVGPKDATVQAHPNLVPADIPVVVLIGAKSASGAEVFAATLRDHGRATIIGKERSAGKGTTNRWFYLRQGEYGALFLATGLWLAPKGQFVEPLRADQDGGLVPQILVQWTERDYFLNGQDPNWDPEIFAALDVLAE